MSRLSRKELENIAEKAVIYQDAQGRRAFNPGNERLMSAVAHADRELADALGPWRQEQARLQSGGTIPLKEWLSFCHNCGEKGPHLAPSKGDPGMYVCDPNPELVARKENDLREKYGARLEVT